MRTRFILPALLLPTLSPIVQAQPSLTIYNQNFAVVRDTIPFDLQSGVNQVTYDGATSQLEADSVILRDPAGKVALQILEQSYRNDPLTQESLLHHFEGREIEFESVGTGNITRIVRGKIVRSGFTRADNPHSPHSAVLSSPIIEVEGKLQFQLPGKPIFPSLGSDTILNPRLEWKLNASAEGKLDAEVAYITRGMSWEADYNVVAPEKGSKVDLIGWVTMENKTGRTFPEAAIKLMAGDVQKIEPEQARFSGRMLAMAAPAAPVVTEKAFDDFHLYTLQNPVTLRDNETKQVEFVRATGIEARRLYVYDGLKADWNLWRNRLVGADENFGSEYDTKVAIVREFENTKENGLGIPLPKGRLRFYLQDDDRRLEFTGESEIDHTARNETIRVTTGNAFDLVGERRRTNWKVDSNRKTAEESIEIKVRNRKDEPVEIIVKEHLARWMNWEITGKSAEFEKKNAQEIEFKVGLEPDEEKTITYTVRYSW